MPTRSDDARTRLPPSPQLSVTAQMRTPTADIRKRMDDVYSEMEQSSRGGRLRLPFKFVGFHQTDVLFQFTRAAVGYALAFVKVKSLEKEDAERAGAEELAMLHASQMQNQFRLHERLAEDMLQRSRQEERDEWKHRLQQAVGSHGECATLLAETYARLVLHCSNFEHHKEDERFFESVYFFVCSVVKVGLALEHWVAVEDELAFLFRGPQFSATIKRHSVTKTRRDQTAAAAAVAATEAASSATSAAKRIQSLTAASSSTKDAGSGPAAESSLFALPSAPTTRYCYFSASLPVGKIVSELDAATLRATRNMEVSQSIRDRIQSTRDEQQQQRRRRQDDALASPRLDARMELEHTPALLASPRAARVDAEASGFVLPQPPRQRPHAPSSTGSPRLSVKAALTSRSPAVNYLLPGTEDRVRFALEDYERGFQQKRQEQRHRLDVARQLEASAMRSDLSCCSSASTTLPPPASKR